MHTLMEDKKLRSSISLSQLYSVAFHEVFFGSILNSLSESAAETNVLISRA